MTRLRLFATGLGMVLASIPRVAVAALCCIAVVAAAGSWDTVTNGTNLGQANLRVGSGSQLRPFSGGVIEANEYGYTPAVPGDWSGASWLPAGQVTDALDSLASWTKYYLGYYDAVVDIDGDANACLNAQKNAIYPALSGANAEYHVWIRGRSRSLTALRSYTNYDACLVVATSSSYDANGYPDESGYTTLNSRRIYIDTTGLDIGISQTGQSKVKVVLQVGGTPSNWNSEFTGALSEAVFMRGQPTLACDGFSPTSWTAGRINSMSGSGRMFTGGEWSATSCVGIFESNNKRTDWMDFHPHLYSSTANVANVGWLAVNSWVVDRGRFWSQGMYTGAQLYGNVIGSVMLKAESMGYGLVCGDRIGNTCSGLVVRGSQLESASFSEVLIVGGHTLTFDGVHIESEEDDAKGKAAHILIGAGFGDASDGYRPCWRDQDLPSGEACTSPTVEATRYFGQINFLNTSLPSDRYRKAFVLGSYSNRSSFAACVSPGATVTFTGGEQAYVRLFDDSYWGTDRLLVSYEAGTSPSDQPEIGDTVTCGAHTAVLAGYGGYAASLALGPGAVIGDASRSNREASKVTFSGSASVAAFMADNEMRIFGSNSVLFVRYPTAYLKMDYSGAAVGSFYYPPVGYPAGYVAGGDLASLEYLRLPLAGCLSGAATIDGTPFTSRASDPPTMKCLSGSNSNVGAVSFPDGSTRRTKVIVPFPREIRKLYNTQYLAARVFWRTTATSGDVEWDVYVDCVGEGESIDRSIGSPYAVVDAANGVSGALSVAEIAQVGASDCAAGELAYVTLERQGGDTPDTLAADADVVGFELYWPRYVW